MEIQMLNSIPDMIAFGGQAFGMVLDEVMKIQPL